MAQASWTYPDEKGRRHSVGLYHGDSSGHFVLYCNGSIITVDFRVFEPKTYSFFIEEELCEVSIIKKTGGGFEYTFLINTEIETQSNLQRNETIRTNKRKTLYAGIGIVATLVLVSILGIWYGGEQKVKRFFGPYCHYKGNKLASTDLMRLGIGSEFSYLGAVESKEKEKKQALFEWKSAQGERFEIAAELSFFDGKIWLPTGFPLTKGDCFYGRYLHSEPLKQYVIDFAQPTSQTLAGYFGLILEDERGLFPYTDEKLAPCRLHTIFKARGLPGLGLLMHRTTAATQHDRFNQEILSKMLSEPNLKHQIESECR